MFLALFALLQYGWQSARGTALERWVIDLGTVKPAAALIGVVTPELRAVPQGASIRAPGGGLNILNGCEGTEVLFLLCAALAVAPLSLRQRMLGLLAGGLLVYALNQARILALFYASRDDRALFDLLHGTVAPLALIAVVGMFFLAWTSLAHRKA